MRKNILVGMACLAIFLAAYFGGIIATISYTTGINPKNVLLTGDNGGSNKPFVRLCGDEGGSGKPFFTQNQNGT